MKKSFISLVLACISVIILTGFSLWEPWEVSPTNYYFANVPSGEYRDAQFTLSNNYWFAKEGTVSIDSPSPQYFSCISGCSYYVEPGEEHTVIIRFDSDPFGGGGAGSTGATIEFPTHSEVIYGYIGASVSGQ